MNEDDDELEDERENDEEGKEEEEDEERNEEEKEEEAERPSDNRRRASNKRKTTRGAYGTGHSDRRRRETAPRREENAHKRGRGDHTEHTHAGTKKKEWCLIATPMCWISLLRKATEASQA